MATSEQLHRLYDHCLGFARKMLEKGGEFFPFAAEIGVDGKLAAVGYFDGNERPSPQDLYKSLIGLMRIRAESHQIIAAAIASDVTIPTHLSAPYSDGIRVQLEDETTGRYIYVPYKFAVQPRYAGNVMFANPLSIDMKQREIFR